uniref:FGGY carbohydrate kinase domain-containing protein n=1 Tax=Timema monikensis TaxID=170555 RepID=A0A7R9HKT0_9NEOP|nr:unnamed protein product [Timema monikensis]
MANISSLKESYFVGVDVGSGSVRAALVDKCGKILRVSYKDTKTWSPKPDYFEQSSSEIWSSCCAVVRDISENVNVSCIKGIGFDATCSLVALNDNGEPLSVSPSGNNDQNVILWLDHRAIEETNFINSLNHSVLKYVGGKISLEMETPKLLWLKKNLKEQCWDKAGWFFDLPDFLTWKATGTDSRSLCSLVCKWTFQADPKGYTGWSKSYFEEIGLSDLAANNWHKIGSHWKKPGCLVGSGLSELAAQELGLDPGTPVGTSMIDAHAGGLGMIGCLAEGVPSDFSTRLSLICGTSTCHMAVSKEPQFVSGVWGPYYSAMVPSYWLNEGGQSATGKLIDHIIDSHPASITAKQQAGDMHIQTYLGLTLESMAKRQKLPSVTMLTKDVHLWPDFHGNRSPIADPSLKGMISGMSLSANEEDLAILYLAAVQALAYGTRHIMESLTDSGHYFQSLLMCGGLSQSPLFVQTHADALGLPVLKPMETESVLVGAAILGACAAKFFDDMHTAITAMGGEADVVQPRPLECRWDRHTLAYHEKKYRVFLKMVEHQKEYRTIMSEFDN